MFLLVLRKMLNNKWMVACLLIGYVLASAMVSSIPLYTKGILQRVLTKDLENFQSTAGYFPGAYQVKADLFQVKGERRVQNYEDINEKITGNMIAELGIPVLAKVNTLGVELALPKETQDAKDTRNVFIKLESLSELEQHVNITNGRVFNPNADGDFFEVIITNEIMNLQGLVLDRIYTIRDELSDDKKTFKIKVVGVFTFKDPADPYWQKTLGEFRQSFLMDYSLFKENFVKRESPIFTYSEWHYALDYHKIIINQLKSILEAYEYQTDWFKNHENQPKFKMMCVQILEQYYEREKQLKTTLLILQFPIFIILAFYIFMVSQLIIDHEKNEIAVLKSRGSSGRQIFIMYLLESSVLSLIGLLLGPPLGLFLCKIMGSSNGFLEFVQRTALPVTFDIYTYLYSAAALFLSIITMLIPALFSSSVTIVQYKQSKARTRKWLFWQKYFLDFIFLAMAGYGFYRYNMQRKMLLFTGIKPTDLGIDPLLFLNSTFFIIGTGMLFLRVFPYIVRFIFWLGRKFWSPVLYASFIQVGRTAGQEQFLMLFIIFTLSIGIFNANAARTLNRNVEDRAIYEIGADMTIMANWQTDAPPAGSEDFEGGAAASFSLNTGAGNYFEPYFMPYTQLSGVEAATKVFLKSDVIVSMPTVKGKETSVGKVNLMGIIPYEFGRVAWFRPDLLPHHWYNYLNLMTDDRTALLVSRSFQKKYNLKEGDPLNINWKGQGYLYGVIYAFIDYWPTYNKNAGKESNNKGFEQPFIVADLNYIQNELALEPYEVWIKKKPGAASGEIYKDMEEKNLTDNKQIKDSGAQIITVKNDPLLQGTNGALTLGFIATIAICSMGFLIYWILSIKGRLLQFGIFRAMGMSIGDVIGMLISEQVLISGMSILMGIIIGRVSSSLFVRLFEIVYSAEQQVLPFKVVEYAKDYMRLYMVVSAMLIIGMGILASIISRIKINQVIKLGED